MKSLAIYSILALLAPSYAAIIPTFLPESYLVPIEVVKRDYALTTLGSEDLNSNFVTQIIDGQVQVVSQIDDGQIQAPTSTSALIPISQIDDGQIQAPTLTTSEVISTLTPVSQISDGQIQGTLTVTETTFQTSLTVTTITSDGSLILSTITPTASDFEIIETGSSFYFEPIGSNTDVIVIATTDVIDQNTYTVLTVTSTNSLGIEITTATDVIVSTNEAGQTVLLPITTTVTTDSASSETGLSSFQSQFLNSADSMKLNLILLSISFILVNLTVLF
ncbi:uncharacterized protein ASCRUDRAFT_76798 [Ascoidea rubescens DSM 1968]|uniref:Uncharacterized protein n=1 Tax=Ascoidea rubescens DSM 1968 TaxID=1344418 RepID=A0A1D2VE19_9ASCO|nr:hypothetical protein ASCRUDRAFT_76798 [Ascoidea rubescens DSM 1968]ODV59849.1 hypothetical protein ASCRUDRAFT_76798 [Ascoidea rubescens DSM 1968]